MLAGDYNLENFKEDTQIFLSVGELLDFIQRHKISRDAKVLYERIDDFYFNNAGWKTYKKDNDTATPETSNEERIQMQDFVVAFSCIKYFDDENLYITAHY